MNDQLTSILKEALMDLESLQEYFHWQLGVTVKYLGKNIEKYKYSSILNKFFYSLTNEENTIKLSDEERSIIDKIVDKYEIVEEENAISVKYSLKNTDDLKNYELSPEKGQNEIRKLVDRPKILFESTLITLLIKYEDCIAKLFRFLVENYPNAYLSDKSITYAELVDINESFKDVQKRFIDKEIDELMRYPISEWYKKIKDKHKIKFAFTEPVFTEFTKVYYARNIIVHNQGIVNDSYLKGTNDKDYLIGDQIYLDRDYIDKAIELTRLILIGTFWGIKKLSKDKNQLITYLFNKGYDCLVEKNWGLAKFINSTLMEDIEQEEAMLLCERVNYWIAEKNASGLETIREEVEALDTSSMRRQFVIAKCALLNDYTSLSKELELAIDTEIPASYIAEWPLFNDYRKSENYKEFVENHKDQFKVFGYDAEGDNADYLEDASKNIENEKHNLITQLANSTSFASTHSIINNLSDFDDWTDGDIEKLCEIALNNTQIRWILDDDDVKEFYKHILSSVKDEKAGENTVELLSYYNFIE